MENTCESCSTYGEPCVNCAIPVKEPNFSQTVVTYLNKLGCTKKGKFAKAKKVSKRKTKVNMRDDSRYRNTWLHEEEDADDSWTNPFISDPCDSDDDDLW